MYSLPMAGTMTPKLVGMALASMGIEPLAALRSLKSYKELHIELFAVVRPFNSGIRDELLLCESLIEVLTSMVDNGTSLAELALPSTIASQAH